MRLREIRIQNFRSFEDETVHLDGYTCLVGPNGSGKSAILMALNVFFRESAATQTDTLILNEEDFHHRNVKNPVKITLVFEGLSTEAQEEFKHYYRQGKLVVFARADWDEKQRNAPVNQYGSRLVMKAFAPFFEAMDNKAKVAELRDLYRKMRVEYPDLDDVSTKDDMEASLRNYEEHHPELCELLDDHAELYGWTRGLNRLAKYIQWVYVPAIKDPSAEQEEAGKTALGKLLARTVRTKVDFSDDVAAVKAEVVEKYTKMLDQRQDALNGLRISLEGRLQEYAGGQARLDLQWHYDDKQSIKISDPSAWAHIGDGPFIGQVGRSGHGLQRAFLVALMHELAGNDVPGGPSLLLGFEEPELYQHPPQAKRLANVLEKLSSDGGNSQLVVTTHCPYFVSSKAFENVRMVRKDNVGRTRVTATTLVELEECLSSALCEKPKSPSSLMARLGQILEPSQNELFFTSAAVFVEGREDVAFISTQLGLSNQLGEFAELGCHFVPADGKTNMSRLVAIASKLQIPFFVIFDADGDETHPDERTKHKRDNLCLMRLCGATNPAPFSDETIWGDNVVVWPKRILESVRADIGEETWGGAQGRARSKYGLPSKEVNRKNSALIAYTLEELKEEGRQSPSLIRLCGQLLQWAAKVHVAGSGRTTPSAAPVTI